jgi:hypothetical protein
MNDAVVKKAKIYAKQRNLSLSKLAEYFFASLELKTDGKNMPLAPITRELAGMVKAAHFKDVKDKDIIADALIEKYL